MDNYKNQNGYMSVLLYVKTVTTFELLAVFIIVMGQEIIPEPNTKII